VSCEERRHVIGFADQLGKEGSGGREVAALGSPFQLGAQGGHPHGADLVAASLRLWAMKDTSGG